MNVQLVKPLLRNLSLPCLHRCNTLGWPGSRWRDDRTGRDDGTRSYTTEKFDTCPQFAVKGPPRKYKPVSHVIFDLDGTILNTEEMNFYASMYYLERVFKKKLTMDLYGLVMGSFSRDGAGLMVKELGLPISQDVLLHGVWQSLRGCLHNSKEMPGINYLACHFERCKVPMALATSSTQETYVLKTKKHKKLFSKFCPIIVGGSEPTLKRGKPHPDIYMMAAHKFGAPPDRVDQILVFEDSLNGVNAAKAAGMQVVMIPSPDLPRHLVELAQPTLILDSFQQFDPKSFGLPPYPKK